MAIGEARLPIVSTHAIPLLRDVWHFALHPSIAPTRLRPGRDYAIALTILLLIDIALTAASIGILQIAEALGYRPLEEVEFDLPPAIEWLVVVIAAPLLEEPLFRGWLSGRRDARRLLFRCVIGLAIIYGGAQVAGEPGNRPLALGIAAFGLAVILASAVRWLHTRKDILPIHPHSNDGFPGSFGPARSRSA